MEENIKKDSEMNKQLENEKKLEELETQIQTHKNELEKEKKNFLLKAAEFDNMKKRLQKESDGKIKYANESLIIKFLDVLDNLNRAIYFAQQSNDFKILLKGVEMTLSQFNEILEKEGIKPIEAYGKEFDPYLHHAISQEKNNEHEENTIVEEVRKGYILEGKVIRPTLVKVSKKEKDVNENE